jgi:hypothetical protein
VVATTRNKAPDHENRHRASGSKSATSDDGISLIHEPYVRPFYRCNIWHIQGRERDVLVGQRLRLVSLREHHLPKSAPTLLAVASHTHFDHIAGHHEFAERLVHPAEADILAAPDGERTLATAFVGDDMFEAHPDCPLCYAEYRVKAAPATRTIDEGDVLDLATSAGSAAHPAIRRAASARSGDADPVQRRYRLRRPADRGCLPRQPGRLREEHAAPARNCRCALHGGHFASFSGERLRSLIDDWLKAHA